MPGHAPSLLAEESEMMTEEERNVTPIEFIELIDAAIRCARYNGFTPEELHHIFAGAGTLRKVCELSFNELALDDIQARRAAGGNALEDTT
jgi:hypothetical protein